MNRIGYNARLWSEMACVQTSSISFTSDETTFWDRAFGTGFFELTSVTICLTRGLILVNSLQAKLTAIATQSVLNESGA